MGDPRSDSVDRVGMVVVDLVWVNFDLIWVRRQNGSENGTFQMQICQAGPRPPAPPGKTCCPGKSLCFATAIPDGYLFSSL